MPRGRRRQNGEGRVDRESYEQNGFDPDPEEIPDDYFSVRPTAHRPIDEILRDRPKGDYYDG